MEFEDKRAQLVEAERVKTKIYLAYLALQLNLLKEFVKSSTNELEVGRFKNITMLLFSIGSNGTAILNLITRDLFTESYVLARVFLETSVNVCYLSVCDEKEYDNFIDWSKQKIIRSLDSKRKAYKCINNEIPIPDMQFFASRFKEVAKFTGRKGGEKPNWTDVSIYQRIKFIKSVIHSFYSEIYLAALNYIYEDASESAHGTLYGASFHLGLMYGYGTEKSTDSYAYALGMISGMCMLLGLLITGMFQIFVEKFPELAYQ